MTAPSNGDSCNKNLANRAVPHMRQTQCSVLIDRKSSFSHHHLDFLEFRSAARNFCNRAGTNRPILIFRATLLNASV